MRSFGTKVADHLEKEVLSKKNLEKEGADLNVCIYAGLGAKVWLTCSV